MKQLDSTPAEQRAPGEGSLASRVLFVELEGGLLGPGLAWEGVVEVVKRDPRQALWIPLWAFADSGPLAGRAAQEAFRDVESLPYRDRVVAFARQRREEGAQVVLVTTRDEQVARQVADAVGAFDGTLVVPGGDAQGRVQALLADCQQRGYQGFAYLGGKADDLPVWSAADEAVVVEPGESLEASVRRLGRPTVVLQSEPRRGKLRAWVRAVRPVQWVKNVLVFTPVVFSHTFRDIGLWAISSLAFVLFCAVCSAVYILNDLLDLPSDRRHPVKRGRPFAAGELQAKAGLLVACLLLVGATVAAVVLLPAEFTVVLWGYISLNMLYTTWLKRKVMIDILVLAGFYCLRIIAGGAATDLLVSEWLLALSMFLFLSLAFVKRHSELMRLRGTGRLRTDNRGYRVEDAQLLETLGATSGYLGVLVLALYINSDSVKQLYSHPRVLWLVCPLLLYWIGRLWIWTRRGRMVEDPLTFALRDRVSWITLGLILLLAVLAL